MDRSDTRDDDPHSEFLGRIMNDYLERSAKGQQPRIDEYAAQYPRFARAIRDSLQALEVVRNAGGESSDTAPATRSTGRTIGDFAILKELGRGGMGVVYEAEQLSLQRRVALKVLPFAALANETALRRFRNEVRAAASLDHPHIVSVYSVGEDQGVHYFAMQLIRGRSLDEWIRERREATRGDASSTVATGSGASARTNSLSRYFRLVAKLGIQAADALQYAHEQGIIHRDIKPANLLLDGAMKLYIADFGLARIEADAGMTATGDVIGTLRYMSPEQALAKRAVVDHRTDIYSLGATLYELLALRPPFSTKDKSKLLQEIAYHDPPRLRRLTDSIPPELETIVLKALEKQPGDRYADGRELADDLRAFLDHRPIRARPPTALQRMAKWSRRNPSLVATAMLLLAALTVCLGAASVLVWKEQRRASAALVESRRNLREAKAARAREARAKREAQHQQRMASDAASTARQAETRANRELVKLLVATGNVRLDQGDLPGSLPWFAEALRLVAGTPDEFVHRVRLAMVLRRCPKPAVFAEGTCDERSWSPDGRFVLVRNQNRIEVWNVETGRSIHTIRSGAPVVWASFTPAGDRIFTIDAAGAGRLHPIGGDRPIAPPLEIGRGVLHAAFRGADQRIVVLRGVADGEAIELRTWNVQAGMPVTPPIRLASSGPRNGRRRVSLSHDGRWVLATSWTGSSATVWDAATGEVRATIATQHRGGILHSAFAPDRPHFVTTDRNGKAQLWNAETGTPVAPELVHSETSSNVVGTSWIRHACFSRDGRWVAAVGHDKTAVVFDSTDGSKLSGPLKHESELHVAAFSPDGRWLATGAYNGEVCIWDLGVRRPSQTRSRMSDTIWPPRRHGRSSARAAVWFRGLRHCGSIQTLSFGPRGRYLLVGTNGASVVWDLAAAHAGRRTLVLPAGAPTYPAYIRDGSAIIASCDSVRPVAVWDPVTSRPARPMLGNDARRYEISTDGRVCAVANGSGSVRIRDLSLNGNTDFLPAHDSAKIRHVALDHRGRKALSVGEDGRAFLWDSASGVRCRCEFLEDLNVVGGTLNADGTMAALAEADGRIAVYEVADGRLLSEWSVSGIPNRLAFIGADEFLMLYGSGGGVQVRDRRTGRLIRSGRRNGTYIRALALSRDESQWAVGHNDGVVEVWDTRTGEAALSLIRIAGRVDAVSFGPSGRLLLIVGEAAGARLYDARTGQAVGPAMPSALRGARGRVQLDRGVAGSFHPDGSRIVVGTWGEAWEWNIAPDERPVEDLIRVSELLATAHFDDHGNLAALVESRAIATAEKLRRRYPEDFRTSRDDLLGRHSQLADRLIESRDALPHHDAVIAMEPDRWDHHLLRARTHRALGNDRLAIADLSAAVNRAPELGMLHLELASALASHPEPSTDRLERALAEARSATQLAPYHHGTWMQLAKIRLILGEPCKALTAVDRAVAKWNGPYVNAEHHLLRADILFALQRRDEALTDLDKAVEAAPEDLSIHYRRALMLWALRRFDAYRTCCREMVRRIDTAPVDALPWIASACALDADAVSEAERVAARLERRLAEPFERETLVWLGALLYRSGRHDAAVDRLRQAILPDEAKDAGGSAALVAPWFLALAEHALGHSDRARRRLLQARRSTADHLERPFVPWEERVLLEGLRREAERVLDRIGVETGSLPGELGSPHRTARHDLDSRRRSASE